MLLNKGNFYLHGKFLALPEAHYSITLFCINRSTHESNDHTWTVNLKLTDLASGSQIHICLLALANHLHCLHCSHCSPAKYLADCSSHRCELSHNPFSTSAHRRT